jgi:hypothetical protein
MMHMRAGQRVKAYEKTTVEGITFHSKKEARYYQDLLIQKQAGIITKIECQPVFELQPAYRKCCGAILLDTRKVSICPRCGKKVLTTRAITYSADFRVTYADGHVEIVDVKGYETPEFKRTHKIFEYRYPELTLKLVKKVRA